MWDRGIGNVAGDEVLCAENIAFFEAPRNCCSNGGLAAPRYPCNPANTLIVGKLRRPPLELFQDPNTGVRRTERLILFFVSNTMGYAGSKLLLDLILATTLTSDERHERPEVLPFAFQQPVRYGSSA